MPNVAVFDVTGKEVGKIDLSDAVFGIEPNAVVMHEVVVNYLANQRQGTQSALTRSEVSGGGKKPWRQKGTGHARQGSTRAPQWTHGGIVFAPKQKTAYEICVCDWSSDVCSSDLGFGFRDHGRLQDQDRGCHAQRSGR